MPGSDHDNDNDNANDNGNFNGSRELLVQSCPVVDLIAYFTRWLLTPWPGIIIYCIIDVGVLFAYSGYPGGAWH